MVLVVNPRSGGGRITKAMPEIVDHLRARGLEHEIRHTEGPGHAPEIVRDSFRAGKRFIVAVGGDGTIHEVVNGMLENDRPLVEEPVLGVIAAGTGCDFIKTFGIPEMAPHAVAHLDGAEAFPIDLGRMTYMKQGKETTSYFANIAEAGLGGAVVARAAKLPRFLGPMTYFFAFWLALGRHKTAQVKIDLIDRTYEGPMNNLVVANGQFFGGGMKITPKAAPTDGLLDVQIWHARKREAIALMPKVYKGQHIPHEDIEEAKRVRISIESDRPLIIEADGEVLGETPASFEVLKDVILLKS